MHLFVAVREKLKIIQTHIHTISREACLVGTNMENRKFRQSSVGDRLFCSALFAPAVYISQMVSYLFVLWTVYVGTWTDDNIPSIGCSSDIQIYQVPRSFTGPCFGPAF
jgi:hypothetical protein